MTDNRRITRECAMKDLDQALLAAMHAHIAEYQLGSIEANIQMCCETASVQKKKSVFGGSETAILGLVLTDKWLIWAETIAGKHTSAGSANLKQIEMRDYEETAMFNIIPDSGINITGRYSDSKQTGQLFVGLDTGPAGRNFRELLRKAIKNSKN